MRNSESLLGLLTSDIPPKAEVPSEPKHQTQDQLPSQSEFLTFGSKISAGLSFTDGAQNKMSVFGDTDQRFSFTSGTKPTLGNSEAQEEKSGESDNDGTHVEEDEDGPHFEPIVPLPDKVDVKTGEEEEEEMFCKRAKLFRFDSETKEWKERGIGSIKILKHKTSGKVRLVMRREQVLKICANHYINVDMALKPNAGSDKSWVWYAMDYADEMPKTEQLAIRFKTADEAELFKVKFEESQKFISESPQDQQTEKKSENPQPQVSSKEVDLKTLFSKKEGEWDCDVCCVRNAHTSAVCVACNNAAPSTAQVKPVEEPKGSGPVAPPAKQFSFGLSGDSAKNTSSTDVSSKGFMFGSQIPVSFKFGSKDAVVTSAGFGAQAEKKTIQADAPQQEKASAAPAVPFGTGFAQFAKKEGQWDCVSCLVRNDASATECVSCKAPCNTEKRKAASQGELAAMCGKNDEQWDCGTCLVRNEGSSSHCVSCQTANPNMKNKISDASSQPAKTGFNANFNPGPVFQFGTSKDKVSSEGFRFESSTTEAEKSSGSSSFSFSMSAPVGGFQFGIAESEAKPSDGQSQNGSASDILKNIAELHKEKEKEAAPSSSGKKLFAEAEAKPSDGQSQNGSASDLLKNIAELHKEEEKEAAPSSSGKKLFAEAEAKPSDGQSQNGSASDLLKNIAELHKEKEKEAAPSSSGKKLFAEAEAKPSDGQSQNGSTSDLLKNIAELHKEEEKEAAPSSSGKKLFAEAEAKPSDGQSQNGSASDLLKNIAELHKEEEKEAAPSSSGKKLFAEAEAKPSDGQSQNGSASDLLKNIAELHKEKEKEAAPSSSDQSVDADSPDNYPLITGKPNTLSFADLAKSQVSFQKDPTFKGFEGAGKKPFTEFHSGTKADISGDQDDKMYKTEENDNIRCEPEPAPMSDFAEVSTGEESKQDLSSHQSKLCCDDKELCQTPEANLGAQSTKNLVSLPKCDFESDSVQDFNAANFNPGPAFQFGTSKDKVSSEGFRFESSTTEAEKSSDSSSFLFSMSAPVGRFQFGIAESEAKPSDGQSQNGSDLFKNISELHKEKEKEASPSSSDQFVDADSHDNSPLFTGKPNTLSFADLAKSQGSFQKDPTFKGFAGAGEQLFTGFHSSTKADISGDQDEKMYKTEENDNSRFEPVPLPDFVEVSTGEENKQDLFSHQSKLSCDDKDLCQTPGAKLGIQNTNNLVSPPKCDFESDSVKKNFGSPSPSKEKCPVIISSSKDEETAVSRLKTSGPAVSSQSSVGTPFSIPTRSKLCSVTHSYK